MFGLRRGGLVDEAVLAELRAIRAEIHELADRVAGAATRDELEGYVKREEYEARLSSERAGVDARRWWATYGLSVAAMVVGPLVSVLVAHVSLLWR